MQRLDQQQQNRWACGKVKTKSLKLVSFIIGTSNSTHQLCLSTSWVLWVGNRQGDFLPETSQPIVIRVNNNRKDRAICASPRGGRFWNSCSSG